MAKYLGFYLLVMLRLAMAFAGILNETCYDDTGGPLRADEYQDTCPEAEAIIFSWVQKAVSDDPRMAASLLRLHFHDCFVNASHLSFHVFICFCSVVVMLMNTMRVMSFAGL